MCHCHFTEDDIIGNKLKDTAVPHINVPAKIPVEQPSILSKAELGCMEVVYDQPGPSRVVGVDVEIPKLGKSHNVTPPNTPAPTGQGLLAEVKTTRLYSLTLKD